MLIKKNCSQPGCGFHLVLKLKAVFIFLKHPNECSYPDVLTKKHGLHSFLFFLICLHNILLLIVLFFLGNPLCHTTEILLTERIVSPVRHILTIQQVRVLILILHGIKRQTLGRGQNVQHVLPPLCFQTFSNHYAQG